MATPADTGKVDGCGYRPLTLSERARAQGFPPSHRLAGIESEQRLQIGNAVPPNGEPVAR
ncbi:DNA cytosine methyltransferase [Streptomyces bohaiensis]|uniref:DNA cytosine methyltransferase n=1 Tax=Streptomyces bohaiensis TaxID=1431344 RepID=UPI003B7F6486